jgi:hypothetical protein
MDVKAAGAYVNHRDLKGCRVYAYKFVGSCAEYQSILKPYYELFLNSIYNLDFSPI